MNIQLANTKALEHMLGYVDDKQMKDAEQQHLSHDKMHLLGYLDSPQWEDACKVLTEKQDRVDLFKLAKQVDARYNTEFAEIVLVFHVENPHK